MTTVNVVTRRGAMIVGMLDNDVTVRASGGDTITITPAEAIELSRALAFVAGLVRKEVK